MTANLSVLLFVAMCCRPTAAVATNYNNPVEKRFHGATHQQTLYTILSSIEERLRNLDNVYAIQLTKTLEVKLDQYQRKLDTLDAKIVRLESMVSMSLDKLFENISMQNYKDDMAKTSLNSKLDTVYDSLSAKITHLEMKSDENTGNVKTKVDATLNRLEKIEENLLQRDSEIQTEISEVMFAIDELKSSTANLEQNLMNFANETYYETLNVKEGVSKTEEYLNNEIVNMLRQLTNATGLILNATEAGNELQTATRTEIREDFNSYANKVADMNMEIWKSRDNLEKELKLAIAETIKSEIRNVLHSLYSTSPFGNHGYDIGENAFLIDISQTLQENFEKILSNQYKFLDSCHRVQMDESQIESEISVTLEKLITMLENILNTEMEDIKNLEKLIKSHDSKILRNLNQANANTINLVAKTTKSDEIFENELRSISNNMRSLYEYVKKVLPYDTFSILITTVQNISAELSKSTHSFNIRDELHSFKQYLHEKFSRCSKSADLTEDSTSITRQMVDNVFHNNPFFEGTTPVNTDNTNCSDIDINDDYSKLIDLRYEENKKPCIKNENSQSSTTNKVQPKNCTTDKNGTKSCQKKPKMKYKIDVRNSFGSEESDTTTESQNMLTESNFSEETTDSTLDDSTTTNYNS